MKKILKDGPFNRISRDVITNKELSLKAKGLLTLILGLPDNWVFTIVGLQEYFQEGREALLSAMRELIEKGYAVRETRRTQDGRFCPDDYSFYAIPFSFSPQAGNSSAENTVEDMRDTESPEVENPQQLRSIESISNPIKKEKIKKLLACEPFLNVWNKLTATPYWKTKTDAEIQSELESLANYELDEATALAENSLKKGWAKAVYDGSSVKIVEKVRKERPKPLVINPPKPREPEPSPEELARKNQAALVSMAHQFYEEVKKEKCIKAIADLPVAEVFEHLLEIGVIAPAEEQMEAVKKEESLRRQCAAKRKLLEQIFTAWEAEGRELTVPSE